MKLLPTAQKVAKNIREYAISLLESDPEDALFVAKGYGSFLWANHIGILSDIEFEDIFSDNFTYLIKEKKTSKEFEVLHLMTSAFTSGGHTGVVVKLLVNSDRDGLAVIDDLPQLVVNRLPNKIVKFSNFRRRSGVETISEIIEIGSRYKTLVLHIHPDDIYSAIAANLLNKLGVNVFLYNHADHAFSFGFSAVQKVFEISKYGWQMGSRRKITGRQSFVGIPIDLTKITKKTNIKQINSIFLAGSADKFIPWNEFSVPTLINKVFEEKICNKHLSVTICGPNGSESFWKEIDSSVRDNISFTGRIDYSQYLEKLSNCDCYIDSFPIANGTTFPEAVMLGIPSFGLSMYAGYSCADILRSPSLEHLLEVLEMYNSNMSQYYSRVLEVREQIILEQSPEVCALRMRGVIAGGLQIPLLDSLSSMFCIENFIESHWESKGKINIPLSLLRNIKVGHKLDILRIILAGYSFISTDFSAVRNKLSRR
jgi:hypothetical protein